MNPEKLLEIASNVLRNRPTSQWGPWQICYMDGRIQCVSIYCTRKPEIIFLVVNEQEAREGLTGPHWDRLSNSIARFWSQKKL